MSDLPQLQTSGELVRMKSEHPVVLRFAEMFPSALARYEMHATRKGGNLDHIDPIRSGSNRLLIGGSDWRAKLEQEIDAATAANLAAELEALRRRKRWKEIDQRLRQGKEPPWRASTGGPLREVILTAHRAWFADADADTPETRAQRFEAQAIKWLQSRFGDAVVHARADHDEMTYHIHAILAPWAEKNSVRRGSQRLLQPSSNPLLKNYEAAQDDVGEFFAILGLKRGKRRAEKRREIAERIVERERKRANLVANGGCVPDDLSADQDPRPPDPVRHKPTPVWWAEEQERLLQTAMRQARARRRAEDDARVLADRSIALARRESQLASREADAQEVLDTAEAIASGTPLNEIKPKRSLGTMARRMADAVLNIRLDIDQKALKYSVEIARARAKVDAEWKALVVLRRAVEAYREKLLNDLPGFARRAADALIRPAKDAVEAAEEAVRKVRGKGRDDER
jgi:hypothetical protein